MSSLLSSTALLVTAIALWLLAVATIHVIYNLFFHPLSRYPGPRSAAVTPLVYLWHFVSGDTVSWLDSLHNRYGEVVRIEPGRLSYVAPLAWKDIYGHATGTRKANSKEKKNSKNLFSNGSYSISSAHGQEHQRLRRIFSHAFSDRAITKQEPMLRSYSSKMVEMVHREIAKAGSCTGGAVVDAVSLFNFVTFDIMADLTFGESLGCLEKGAPNSWVDAVQGSFKSMVIRGSLRPYRVLSFLWETSQSKKDRETAATHVQSSHDRVTKRLERRSDARDDIWGLVLQAEGPNALTRAEMNNNANNFMIVGTETSATALSALTYLLLKNPNKLQCLVKEIRSLSDASQIKGEVVKDMPYLQACLWECLRLHPPVPTGGLRVIGPGGNTILGHLLPEDTKLSVATWTAFRTPLFWKDGDKFIPERWIVGAAGYEEYHAYDRHDVFQAFGTGPRACIGKNTSANEHPFEGHASLAYQEMRLIYANFLFHFDMELCEESDRWMEDQKSWILWFKPDLPIRVFARKSNDVSDHSN